MGQHDGSGGERRWSRKKKKKRRGGGRGSGGGEEEAVYGGVAPFSFFSMLSSVSSGTEVFKIGRAHV